VFAAAFEAGAAPLVVLAVIASAIAGFFYVRLIVLMFFTDANNDEVSVVVPSLFTRTAISASVFVTLLLGVVPGPLLDLLADVVFLK
jgi:NADH-quinone oxidoreductase subunit N